MNTHPNYQSLVDKAAWCHQKGRTSDTITPGDVALARLYSYALRAHSIGAFHATRLAVLARPPAPADACGHSSALRRFAVQSLEDLANQAMEDVPDDFRVLLATFYRYHRGIERVIECLREDAAVSRDAAVAEAVGRFERLVGEIAGCNGIHLTRDTEAPPQASFVVPNLGITIVPLVYGDHHSWNLAWLGGRRSDVPYHRHHEGVEIHLGYSPIKGLTVLGDRAAPVTEGYAMPVPPDTRHGYTNDSDLDHHVPFVFGSMKHGGWGVFLDVDSQPATLDQLTITPRDHAQFRQTVHLEREIAAAARSPGARRRPLIPASVTQRNGSGGLELSITRVPPAGMTLKAETFLACSVVNGSGVVGIAGAERAITHHDHFGVPAGLTATLRQAGDTPLVLLDAALRGKSW